MLGERNGKMIKLKDVEKTYKMGETEVRALRGLDLEIKDGQFVAIVGPSGSGKSTLMHIIGALDVPDKGEVLMNGENISIYSENELANLRGERVGFVFQTFNLIHTLNSLENVTLPMTFQGTHRREREKRGKELLEKVGLGNRLEHKPAELSGGEQQRVAIARALINNPKILLADEPTGNLDTDTGRGIMDLLKELNEEHGMTVVIVTHNPKDADYAHQKVHMVDGKLVESDNAMEGA